MREVVPPIPENVDEVLAGVLPECDSAAFSSYPEMDNNMTDPGEVPPTPELCPACGHAWSEHPDRTCTHTLNERPRGCRECDRMFALLDEAWGASRG